MNERDIFLAAIEIADPAERASFLDQSCDGNAELRAQVEELLKTHEAMSQFLEIPAAASASTIDRTYISNSTHGNDEDVSVETQLSQYLEPPTRSGWLGKLAHYQMVSGRPPFRAANTMAVLKRVCEDTPRPIDDVIPETPEWLTTNIFRLLEKDPDKRFQNAQEVADLLAQCQKELKENHNVTCVGTSHQTDQRRSSLQSWLIGCIVTVIALLGILFMNGPRDNANSNVASQAEQHVKFQSASTEPKSQPSTWHGWPADAPPPAIAPFDADQAKQHQENWAKYIGVPVEYENCIGMRFRLIPPGEYSMGKTHDEVALGLRGAGENVSWRERARAEGPQHKDVLTQPIYVSTTEVTQSQYERLTGSTPSNFTQGQPGGDLVANLNTGDFPVEMVSWNDAANFCNRLSQRDQSMPFYVESEDDNARPQESGYRLPTEAEWEWACRAGTTTRFWTGDAAESLSTTAWFNGNSDGRTHAVGN